MQLQSLAYPQSAMGSRQVVEQEQLARSQRNSLFDRLQVKAPLNKVVALLGKGLELHAAQEAGLTGVRQRWRVVSCLDEAGEDPLDIVRRALDAVAGIRLSVSAEPVKEEFGLHPGSLAEQSAKRDDASARSRSRAVWIDVQSREARHVAWASRRYRKPEIHVQYLEVPAPRAERRNRELPHDAQ